MRQRQRIPGHLQVRVLRPTFGYQEVVLYFWKRTTGKRLNKRSPVRLHAVIPTYCTTIPTCQRQTSPYKETCITRQVTPFVLIEEYSAETRQGLYVIVQYPNLWVEGMIYLNSLYLLYQDFLYPSDLHLVFLLNITNSFLHFLNPTSAKSLREKLRR